MTNPDSFERIEAEIWTPHPDFSRASAENDIGIVRLSRAVSVEPVALSFYSSFPEQGDDVIVIGFGFIAEDGPLSNELLRIDVQVGVNQECDLIFGGISDEIQFCAGGAGEVRRC